jgi:hypothetical protein
MVISLVIAVLIRTHLTENSAPAYWLVGAWALLTPLWFIWEWHTFKGDKAAFEHFKYGQELARNVWIALVVVLAVITGIKWGP